MRGKNKFTIQERIILDSTIFNLIKNHEGRGSVRKRDLEWVTAVGMWQKQNLSITRDECRASMIFGTFTLNIDSWWIYHVRQEVLDFTCRDVILKRWHQCLEFETSSSGIEKRIARKIENRYGWKDEIEKNDGWMEL